MKTLTTADVEPVAGGLTWGQFGVGFAMLSLGVGIAAMGGLGGIAVGVIWGAGFATNLALAGTALGLAGIVGAVIGNALYD